MTYNTEVERTQQRVLTELFEIRTDAGNSYYADFERDVLFNNHTYRAATIKRSNFTFDNKLSIVTCTVSASVLDEFAKYIAYYPTDRARITIYRATEEDMDEFAVLFDGYVQSVGFNNGIATVRIEEKSSILSSELNMFVFQANCNHHIFDSGCKLDYINWVVNATVLNVSGHTITTDDVLGYDTDYFVAGEVHYLGDARLITGYSGNVLTLHVPFDSRVGIGSVVEVMPSCGGDKEKCRDTFNNFDNYLGCPYIPNKNPSIWGV